MDEIISQLKNGKVVYNVIFIVLLKSWKKLANGDFFRIWTEETLFKKTLETHKTDFYIIHITIMTGILFLPRNITPK